MSVQELESAIARLSPPELAQLAEWFDRYFAERWDRQIEEDSRAGRLDRLIQEAGQDFEAGRCRPI